MPAETHQHSEQLGRASVLDLLACILGLEVDDLASVPLAELELDDDLALLHLWDDVVEEAGERSVGDLDMDGPRPATLGELAELFAGELGAADQ